MTATDGPAAVPGTRTARGVVVAASGDVPPGALHAARVDGRSVVVANVGGELVAVDGTCPHAGGPLGDGRLVDGWRLECPWHRAAFDLTSGAPCRGPARKPVRHYPVRVDGDAIVVTLDERKPSHLTVSSPRPPVGARQAHGDPPHTRRNRHT